MFKRREKLPLRIRIREALWPSMGWGRAFDYWRHRVFRTGDSTWAITAGLACGAAVSFNPFLGTHILQAFFLAWLMRASLIAAFIGTALGNPSTLPFLLWISYQTGVHIIELFGTADTMTLPDQFTWRTIVHEPMRLLLPMSAGGIVCGIAAWPLVYIVCYYPVRSARKLYRLRRMRQYRKHHPVGAP